MKRRKTKAIKIGNIYIGADKPVAIQSMTKAATKDTRLTLRQIQQLESAGCEIIRLSIADFQDAMAIKKLKSSTRAALVADIHYDFRLALAAIDNGIDKVRLNPGNIYKKEEIGEVAKAAKKAHIPIRVGVNSGSLRQAPADRNRRRLSLSSQMAKTALDYIRTLEKFGFSDIVVSLKASNISDTIDAYRKAARLCDYPFHLGVTATGPAYEGIVKSALCIGVLLSEGIGDTIRISLTGTPQEEVKAAKAILAGLGLRHFGPEIISCPTCGRCQVDLISMVRDFENRLNVFNVKSRTGKLETMKLAIMGCMVNGPGEAKEADLGVAFGKKEGMLFKKGNPLRKVASNMCIIELLREMER